MQDTLATALYWHRSGQLDLAAALYRQILAQAPDNVDALHLLGVIHHQRGEHAAAIDAIGRAISLHPETAAFYVNLAEAHRALGQEEPAVALYQTALRLRPDLAYAHFNLGAALQSLGRVAEAVEPFRRAAQLLPNTIHVHNSLGGVLRQLGKAEEALAPLRRAAELAPNDAVAQCNLGQLLLSLNRPEAAVPPCRASVRLQPGNATLRLILADALRCAGQFEESRLSYLKAIQLQPTLAQAHANLGLLFRARREIVEALGPFQKAVALEPNNAKFWQYLAEANNDWSDYETAISCWQRAMMLRPGQAEMHLGLSDALVESGRFEEAEEHIRIAMRLQPDSAAVHFSLGCLYEHLNDKRQAEAAFRTALRIQPAFTMARVQLIRLLRGRVSDGDRLAIKEILADPNLNEDVRIKLSFALAAVQDACGDFASAAAHAGRGHTLSLERARRGGMEYDPQEHRRFVDQILLAFGPDFFKRTAGGGLETQQPVFIVGLPRSGTTLIEQILASHGRVYGAGELRLVTQTALAIPSLFGGSGDPLDYVSALEPLAIRRMAEQHLDRLTACAGGLAERIIDKMPHNYQHLGLLAALFPRAIFIHCRRDLRDVAVSCWLTHFGWLPWTNDFGHIASRFEEYGRLMEHWRRVLPVTLHEVDYEEVVNDLEGTARRLVAACELNWDPACLEFYRTKRPVRTASAPQVRTPLYQRSVGRWKHYERELADLLAQLPHGA
jgi:tetratricopeptide (TPR) repeat protein